MVTCGQSLIGNRVCRHFAVDRWPVDALVLDDRRLETVDDVVAVEPSGGALVIVEDGGGRRAVWHPVGA